MTVFLLDSAKGFILVLLINLAGYQPLLMFGFLFIGLIRSRIFPFSEREGRARSCNAGREFTLLVPLSSYHMWTSILSNKTKESTV